MEQRSHKKQKNKLQIQKTLYKISLKTDFRKLFYNSFLLQ